jgi:thermolysin
MDKGPEKGSSKKGGDKRRPTKEQQAILDRLKKLDPDLAYEWHSALGVPRRLRGKLSPAKEGDPLIIARDFLAEHRALFGLTDVDKELGVKRVRRDRVGTSHIRLQQHWKDIPVFGVELIVHVAADNTVRGTTGQYHPAIDAASEPAISAEDAMAVAKEDAGEASEIEGQEPKLEVFHKDGEYTLCWHVKLDGMDEERPALWEYFVDAESGAVVFRYNNLQFHTATTGWGRGRYAGCVRLNTYHDHDGSTYQLRDATRAGIEVRTYDLAGSTNRDALTLSEDANNRWTNTDRTPRRNSQEPEVDAHYYTGMVVDYFLNTFGRNGWDDAGSDSEVCVHYGIDRTGSFWDPTRHRVFHPDGDGTDIDYKPGLDVVAHEFTHGVTQTEVDLNYWGESGSLCEAYSDFFACMIQEDWVFEEHVYLGATAPDDALRSLYDPTLYGDPDHYSNIGGSMHGNSGIVTKAGYLMTHGGTHNNIEVFGLGRRVTEQIWYQALQYLTASSDFSDFREALEDACDDLYPFNAWPKASVQNAMAAVGIGSSVSYPSCPRWIVKPCLFRLEPVPCKFRLEGQEKCPYVVEVEPCLAKLEVEPCLAKLEVEPCLSRVEVGVGPCCTRELILEPRPVCIHGDIPVFTPEGCMRETIIVGRLTESGRVEPLSVGAGPEGQPLTHVRILTQKRQD